MRFSLKHVSLGLALASFAAVGLASAQSLAGTDAQLDHSISSKTAKAGETVTAKLKDSVTADGVKLPKGTTLVGTITAASSAEKGAPAKLSIAFTKAELKHGKNVDVKATVIAAYPADQADQTGGVPATVAPDSSIQQTAAVDKATLSSAVKSSNSATFTRQDRDFTLKAGTYLQLGIAPASATTQSAAE